MAIGKDKGLLTASHSLSQPLTAFPQASHGALASHSCESMGRISYDSKARGQASQGAPSTRRATSQGYGSQGYGSQG